MLGIFTARRQYHRRVAIKRDKNPDRDDNRVHHEKKILKQMENSECPYIAKFYYSEHPLHENDLMMEFYPSKSFDHFKNSF
jgi:hypothetical protein